MADKWNYTGDMNIENGGLFWKGESSDDYVEVVEVTPCSDAGGPDNLFHVATGTLYMPHDKRQDALDTCGYKLVDGGILDCTGEVHPLDTLHGQTLLVDAFRGSHGIERDSETVVRIGPVDEYSGGVNGWNPEPDTILRADAKLRNYLRKEFGV